MRVANVCGGGRRTAAALAFVCVAAAQTPPVVLHVTACGPAAWRSRLGPTTVGTMLATEAAEAVWRGQIDDLDAALRSANVAKAQAGERPRPLFFDYAGDMELVVWLEQAEDAVHLRRWSAACIVGHDGRTDVAAMVDECRVWLERTSAAAAPNWLDMRVSPPVRHGERTFVTLACEEDAVAAGERAKTFAARPRGDAVLRVDVEAPAALGLLRDRGAERGFVEALLGATTRRLTLEVRNAGPRVAIDLTIGFGDGDRGVLRGLLPSGAGVPDLTRFVPPDVAGHYAGPFDAPATLRSAIAATAVATELEPATVETMFRSAIGCDAQVLAMLEHEAVVTWYAARGDSGDGPFADVCVVVPVREHAKIIEAATPLLQAGRALPQLGDDGVLRATPGDRSLAIGFGVLCIASGSRGADRCEDVLDLAAAGRRPEAPRERAVRDAPPGCNARGRVGVAAVVGPMLGRQLLLFAALLGGGQDPGRLVQVQRELERWSPLLRAHGLAEAELLGGVTASSWQLRVLW